MVREKRFYIDFFKVAFPLVLQQVITFCVQMLDTVMVGALGDKAVSAVTLGTQPYFIFSTIVFGFTSGGAILISQYWGKQDIKKIKEIMAMMLVFITVITLIYMGICSLFPFQIMGIFSKDPDTIIGSVRYLRIVVFAYLFYAIATCYYVSLSAKESVKFSTYVYIASFFVNLVANYVFIFGFGPIEGMGVAGAAVGTLFARGFELLCAWGHARFLSGDIHLEWEDFLHIDRKLIPIFIKTSILVLMDDLVWSLNMSAQMAVIGNVNPDYVAAASIANVASNFAIIVIFATSRAASIIMGKIVGQGNKEKALQAGRTILLMSIVIGIIASGLLLLIREPIMLLYPNVSLETKSLAQSIITVLAIIFLVTGPENSTIVGILRGAGDTRFAFWTDALCMWCIGFPIGCLAAFVWKLPIVYVYFLLRCDIFIKISICIWRVLKGNYIKDITLSKTVKTSLEEV